ncbi:MAG: sugar nucleotide-binding protein [Nocardioides sp.]
MTEPLRVEESSIPGLLVVHLPLHGDGRGWFKENWQREKMTGLGLPDFGPVQNNVSFNASVAVTRGLHAEPWDKYVSVATGRIFGAWVDLRQGATFGRVFTLELGPETAVFVPRGVANGFQTLAPSTAYTYLVNDHWSASAREKYTFVNAADPALGIAWPHDLASAELSQADRDHPPLAEVTPFAPLRTAVLGATGQVGQAFLAAHSEADGFARDRLDLGSAAGWDELPWGDYDVIVNAAAYTAVDTAETPDGRRLAWAANVEGVGRLVDRARCHRATLVHVSSDYVFDGERDDHPEDEPFSPLGVYGQTKAAGDALVAGWERHYVLRTSWVIGAGGNFVRTMARLADQGVSPAVVDDQTGRLTFADDLVDAARHLLAVGAPYGTYNVTGGGPLMSWADIAALVFEARGRSASDVRRVSTEEYGVGKELAPRPRRSGLALAKVESTGWVPRDARTSLEAYLATI